MRQQIRFCTPADGVRLAFATFGRGPAIVRASTWLTHLEFDWESPVWHHWLQGLIEAGQVIPVIDRTFPLREAPAAISYVGERSTQGKP